MATIGRPTPESEPIVCMNCEELEQLVKDAYDIAMRDARIAMSAAIFDELEGDNMIVERDYAADLLRRYFKTLTDQLGDYRP